MKPLKIKIKKINPAFRSPTYAHEGDAGMDLYCLDPIEILPGERKKIPFGCSIEIPEGYLGAIAPRSGLAHRFGIGLVNSWGVIDASYRGEICAIIINMGNEKISLPAQTRIAQLLVIPVAKLNINIVEENLIETDRGKDGFGSTGL